MLPSAGQAKPSGSSEYEPLIDHLSSASNSHGNRGSTDLSSKHKLKPAAFWILMVALAASSIAIYAMARATERPSDFTSNVKWVQMEATHSGHVPAAWAEREECGSEHAFTLTLALKQDKMEELHGHVMAVSDPRNADTFRQYWSAEKVRSYFAPAEETVHAVTSWLEAQGFTVENGRMRLRNEQASVLMVDLSCQEANELLNAKFMFYEHVETGQSHLRVQDGVYNVPEEVLEHIDFVHPSVRFPLRHHTKHMEKLDEVELASITSMGGDDLAQYNTPERLYSLYGMTATLEELYTQDGVLSSNENNDVRQAIASYLTQYYKDSDLQLAWDNLGYKGSNVLAQMQRIPENQPEGTGSEAELDTQYITATAPGLDTYVFYVDNNEDPFVTLIEDILDATVPPMVVSISYGGDEYDMGPQYTARCNQEFGKLALLGTTILASSGDSGVRGDDNDCYEGTEYIASFPASAVYVTAVGGVEGGDLNAANTGETAWEFSGGGFSIYFDEPEWQAQAVQGYLDQDVTMPSDERYVAGKRGYPDISAQSVDYVIAVNGDWYLVSGTSASCPAIAGMVSMANVARVAAGKAPLGFLNPSIYQIYDAQSDFNEVFNDVTEGFNEGCRVDEDVGFYTAQGWDPVTGPGSPKFEQLYMRLVEQA